MKLLMLINKHSGLKNSKSSLLDVIDIFCRNGYSVTSYVTQKPHDAYEYLLNNRIRYEIVCVFGGDGTMNEVTNALMKKKYHPTLAYFPSGTMNDFGSNFDLDTDFKEIAERVCKKRIREFDVGKFNDRYFNYVAAFGAMCDVPFTTERSAKEALGNIAYIIEGISKLPEIKKTKTYFEINDRKYAKEILFGLVYSGNRVAGMQLESRKKARIDDGYFNVLLVDYVPTLFDAPDIFNTVLQKNKYIHSFRCKDITFMFDEEDVVWTLDGEKAQIENKKAEISIKNKALKIYV